MKKAWLSLALCFWLTALSGSVTWACPYHDTSASNDTTKTAQNSAAPNADLDSN